MGKIFRHEVTGDSITINAIDSFEYGGLFVLSAVEKVGKDENIAEVYVSAEAAVELVQYINDHVELKYVVKPEETA